MSAPIESLRNLGPKSGAWLRGVGITSVAELERLGPALAYRLVRAKQSKVSLNLLWALAAGLQDRDWRGLSDQEKQALRADVDAD